MLNRNPKNYFAEVEQLAFSPAHLVPGIEASPDKMLQVLNIKFTKKICSVGIALNAVHSYAKEFAMYSIRIVQFINGEVVFRHLTLKILKDNILVNLYWL